MDSNFFENKGYLVTKTVVWFLLFCAVGVDWIVHRHDRTQGYQLHRAIFACLCIFVIRDVGLTSYVYTHETTGLEVDVLAKFVFHFAESAFMLLLMTIASGWKTTRASLGKRQQFVVLAPLTSLISSVVADYYLLKEADTPGERTLSSNESIAFEVSLAISMFSYIMIWIWIYQAVKVEEGTLGAKIAGISLENTADPLTGEQLETDLDAADNLPVDGASDGQDGSHNATTDEREPHGAPNTAPPLDEECPSNVSRISLDDDDDGDESDAVTVWGNPVTPPAPGIPTPAVAATVAGPGQSTPPPYSEAVERGTGHARDGSDRARIPDMDEIDSLRVQAERDERDKALIQMPLKAKLRMAVRLKYAVTVYVMMVLFKFIYTALQRDSSDVMIVITDAVLLLLMVFLCWSYRLRKHNPYYMLEDYAEDDEGPDVQAARPMPRPTNIYMGHDHGDGGSGPARYHGSMSDEDMDDVVTFDVA